MKKLLTILFTLFTFAGFAQPKYNWWTQIQGSGFTGYSIASFNGSLTDSIKASSSGQYLQSIAGAPGFEFKNITIDTTDITGFSSKVRGLFSANAPATYSSGIIGVDTTSIVSLATAYDLRLKLNISDTSTMLTNYVNAIAGASYISKSGHTITAATMDTTYISSFSGKVRGLFSANAPITYSSGIISADTSSTVSLATAYDVGLKVNISDTSSMLTNYVNAANAPASRSGHTISIDTTSASGGLASIYDVGLKVNIADTASMLTNYPTDASAPLVKTTKTLSIDTTSTVSIATAYDLTILDGWTTVIKAANYDVTNAINQDDANFQFAVVAGGHYMIRVDATVSASNTTADNAFRFSISAGTMTGNGTYHGTNASAAISSLIITANAAATSSRIPMGSATASNDDLIYIRALYSFTASSNGTLTFQWGNNSATVGAVSRLWKGSIFKYKRLD